MKWWLVVGGVAAVVVLVAVFANRSSDSVDTTAPAQETSTSDPASEQPAENNEPQAAAGQYVTYQDGLIAATAGTKLLFFHASWCPQCRALETSINNSNLPSGLTIMKVDYDTNQALRQKYGVTIQTTLVRVDDDGNLVEKYVAYDSPTFAAVQENLL